MSRKLLKSGASVQKPENVPFFVVDDILCEIGASSKHRRLEKSINTFALRVGVRVQVFFAHHLPTTQDNPEQKEAHCCP